MQDRQGLAVFTTGGQQAICLSPTSRGTRPATLHRPLSSVMVPGGHLDTGLAKSGSPIPATLWELRGIDKPAAPALPYRASCGRCWPTGPQTGPHPDARPLSAKAAHDQKRVICTRRGRKANHDRAVRNRRSARTPGSPGCETGHSPRLPLLGPGPSNGEGGQAPRS